MKKRDVDKLNMIRARKVMRSMLREDAAQVRSDYGVKGMKWGEHTAKEEEESPSRGNKRSSEEKAPQFKTVAEFKKALEDRDARASDRVLAEDEWKEAKAFRASMFGKSEKSLKADMESCKKSGDTDGFERAKHDLNRLQDRVKKYGPDFGLAAAQKKYEQTEKAYADIDNKIKAFDKHRRMGQIHDRALKAAKKIGTSTQKIGDDLYVAFQPHTPAGRQPVRAWGKVVDKPTEGYKEYGTDGEFKVYSKGFWGAGDNPSFGYEFVLEK